MAVKERVRRLLGFGVSHALWHLRFETQVSFRHRRAARALRRRRLERPLKLNLGCGDNPKPGWVNLDAFSDSADARLDLREPLPLPDGVASVVYSEHFFEHLRYPDEAERLLAESMRVLEPGGVFSVGVPDTEPLLRAYPDDASFFAEAREKWHHGMTTPLHQINHHFRQAEEHRYAYDYETLKECLERAGFVGVRRREFEAGLDSEWRRDGTLYVAAQRPPS